MSIDEMTGIQATERQEKDLPMRPGKVQKREFEYIRHGTQTLIANFDIAFIVELLNQLVRIQELNSILFSTLVELLKVSQTLRSGI